MLNFFAENLCCRPNPHSTSLVVGLAVTTISMVIRVATYGKDLSRCENLFPCVLDIDGAFRSS